MDWINPHLHKVIYSSVVAVVSICSHFTTVLMATDTATGSSEAKAQWNMAETNVLLAHLLQNMSEAGDGRNFKTSTFTSAATALSSANLLTAGPPKTNRHCRNKWNLLKGIYQEIQHYHSVSGAHWDNVNGAGINGEAAWETSRSALQQFANSGWMFHDMMAEILPHGTGAQGHNAFTPAAAAAPVLPDKDAAPGAEYILAAAATVIISAACPNTDPIAAFHLPIATSCLPTANFAAPHLPTVAHSTFTSSIGTGKRTHDDALADVDSMSHISTHPSLMGPMASTMLISEPPPQQKNTVTNWDGVTSDSEKTQTVCWEVLQCPKEDKVKVQGTRSEYDQGFGLKDKSKRFCENRD
ncbi:hypothetical protein BDR07DRAFT_1459956 [Suillus spraguei]|nr:hypothetical protein BDR07DRAFT_1459956 [Suillus spraguei]